MKIGFFIPQGMLKKWDSLRMAPTFLLLVIFFSSCDWAKALRPQQNVKSRDEQKEKSAEPAMSLMTQGERFAFHRWLVTEMQEQVLGRAVKNSADVDGWANVLSQRGSIEGVYHGFVLSSEYAALEKGRADLKAVRFFSQEMAALDNPNLADTQDVVRLAREKYAKEYMTAPLFTLKRFLGDKIIKESNARKEDKERLAAWYASFAVRWAAAGVPFGLPQRNKTDEAFHYRWAKENNLGVIQWELLNRVHRVMNAFGGVSLADKQPASQGQKN